MLKLFLFFFFTCFEIIFSIKKKIKNLNLKLFSFFLIFIIFYDFYILTKFIFFYKSIIIIFKKFNFFLFSYFLYFFFIKKNIYFDIFYKTFFLKKQKRLNLNKIKIYAKN